MGSELKLISILRDSDGTRYEISVTPEFFRIREQYIRRRDEIIDKLIEGLNYSFFRKQDFKRNYFYEVYGRRNLND